MTGEPCAEVERGVHRYGKTIAVDDLSLSVPSARLVGLIGPDGVGKSTLLGLLTGVKRVQVGRVRVLGGNVAEMKDRRRVCPRIAYMPQGLGRNLYAELTVAENLDFFGRLFGLDRADRERRAAQLLEATGLAPFPDRQAGKLSGGMKQKLGLCCALIHEPDLLVLDEPTTGVDPLSRLQFWQLVNAIRSRRPSISVIVSTAYMEEAEGFDWLVAMDEGRVLATGTPDQIIRSSGQDSLEAAYRSLLPHASSHEPLVIPPRSNLDGEPVISAQGLTRRFGPFTAVDHVSFQIQRGEIFGFLGSNGCGKSTTMKMLTGLLPVSDGEAWIFGQPVEAQSREARRDIGYMSQSFSLYGELTVGQNLELHARIFSLDRQRRIARMRELGQRFGLETYLSERADALPLGVRQRLSLAVAVIHEPRILILDEPTSGVDPEARDAFWALLVELSRDRGVTIFISTHFMSEAERCDRVSLMHAGKVLACDAPAVLVRNAGVRSLEEAFVHHLVEATSAVAPFADDLPVAEPPERSDTGHGLSLRRFRAYARCEFLNVFADPVRIAFAFFGSAILMVIFCFGISLDIEDLEFAVLDQDRSPESRAYIAAFEGSRYFSQTVPLWSSVEGRERLIDGDITLALEIPPGFGRDLRSGTRPEVLATVDGAMPFKGETVEGYVTGIHNSFVAEWEGQTGVLTPPLAQIEPRFRYNPGFESINAMAPAMPAILLIMLPAILTAVSVAREKELGSITNFYVTPTTKLEFLAGKQSPYILIAFLNFFLLTSMTVALFGVPLKGNVLALTVGAVFYTWATTSFGLIIATLTSSQVAAVFATTLASIIPTIQFSGLLQPVSTLDGGARVFGSLWPASYFLHLNVGAFTKGLGWSDLAPDILALSLFGPVFTLIAVLLLRSQER
ncbi:MAG: ribosome-associated ATPase/putative transporter RbbA [Geminicoccaceae bacterium]